MQDVYLTDMDTYAHQILHTRQIKSDLPHLTIQTKHELLGHYNVCKIRVILIGVIADYIHNALAMYIYITVIYYIL